MCYIVDRPAKKKTGRATTGENATAGGCAVPAEELVSLLRVALAYALPHASPAAFATPLEKFDPRTHLKWEGCCAGTAAGGGEGEAARERRGEARVRPVFS